MTEELWFACRDPQNAINSPRNYLAESCSPARFDRVLRLFAVASARRVMNHCRSDRLFEAITAAELGADGRTNRDRNNLKHMRRVIFVYSERHWLLEAEGRLALAVVGKTGRTAGNYASHWAASLAAGGDTTAYEREKRSQVALLRDVFDNPFRPACYDRRWRTSAALHLAAAMYETRDFAAMPILADALQEAGCDNDDVLNHCRDASGVHVRGCWVVDGVLGKS